MLTRRHLLRLSAGAACGIAGAAEALRMPPADEASRDARLAALLGRMRTMAAQHDFRGLETLMLPTFRVDFDYGKGPGAFHKRWSPESRSSALWPVLRRLLWLGGTFYSPTLFALPYVYTQFPAELDPLSYVVAVKPSAHLLDSPQPDAKVVGTLDYTILQLAERLRPPVTITTGRHLEVKSASGERQFVAESEIYSPAAYRAFFEKRAGRWRWISLACATLAEPPDLLKLTKRAK
jgi:hypothetical protein